MLGLLFPLGILILSFVLTYFLYRHFSRRL